MSRYCVLGFGSQHRPSPLQQFIFSQVNLPAQFSRRGHSNGAHERRSGDTDAGKVRRLGVAVFDDPVDDVRFQKYVPQETEAGDDGGESPRCWFDLEDVYL